MELLRPWPAAIVAAAIALAGCGGGDDGESTADIGELSSCLSDALPDHAVGEAPTGSDAVADEAANGALRIVGAGSGDPLTATNQDIWIVAEGTVDEAGAAKDSYEATDAVGSVEQHGTVVVTALDQLTDEERSAIEGCLDEQGVG